MLVVTLSQFIPCRTEENLVAKGSSTSSNDPELFGFDTDYLALYTAPTSLPVKEIGLGVFAKFDIPRGEILCEYRGIAIDAADRNRVHSDKVFDIRTPDGKIYSLIGDNICTSINDAVHIFSPDESGNYHVPYTTEQIAAFEASEYLDSIPTTPGFAYNAMYDIRPTGKVFVVSMTNITAGSEIFLPYGKDYWLPTLRSLVNPEP